MRRALAASILALSVAMLAAAAPAGAATVRVGDNYFSPKRLTVKQHTILKFRFVGERTHKVKVKRGPDRWSSPRKSSGVFLHHLWLKGTYKLVCSIHRGTQRMTLKVT